MVDPAWSIAKKDAKLNIGIVRIDVWILHDLQTSIEAVNVFDISDAAG